MQMKPDGRPVEGLSSYAQPTGRGARIWPMPASRATLPARLPPCSVTDTDPPKLWVFLLHAVPLPDSPDFSEYGGAFVTCYQMPGLGEDPVCHASGFLRAAGWQVVATETPPVLLACEDAPDEAPFEQALIDDEAYVFHQWRVEDSAGETMH